MPVAYFNGSWLDADAIRLPVYDMGFVQGVAVSEQMRTFGGRLFRLDAHLQRLHNSLEIIGLQSAVSVADLGEIAQQLVSQNHPELDDGDDLGVSLFVTPGPYPTFAPPDVDGPTVGLHSYPLPFGQWYDKYRAGQALVVSEVRQTPSECWPPELKCRSRMHYYLADREAAQREPGARALLLDLQNRVIEASTANVVLYREGTGLISPPQELILPGVSVAFLRELAEELDIPFSQQTLRVPDVLSADEVLLCSTSPCVWPVSSLNGQPIHKGQPGPVGQRLLAAWSEAVGLDIRGQAERFRRRQSK